MPSLPLYLRGWQAEALPDDGLDVLHRRGVVDAHQLALTTVGAEVASTVGGRKFQVNTSQVDGNGYLMKPPDETTTCSIPHLMTWSTAAPVTSA